MERLSDIDRRTYLRGLYGATALAGGTAMTVGGVTDGANTDSDDGGDDEDAPREHPAARPILCDVSDPMGFEIFMHYDGDPAHAEEPAGDSDGDKEKRDEMASDSADSDDDEARKRVVHVTSESPETGEFNETSDYAAGLVNLRKRTRREVTLGELDDGQLAYDYYEGPDHGAGAPDELFLILQTPEQAEAGEGLALFKHVDDGGDAGVWRTLNVTDEMENGDGDWRAIEIHDNPEEMVADGETLGKAVERTAASLRDQESTLPDGVFQEYDEDTEVVGVGFGVGNTGEPVTVDIYYDNLVVNPVPEVASITFEDQQVGRGRNQTVAVDEVAFPEPGGYIDVHDPGDTEDMPLGEIKGAYDQYLEPGVHRRVQIGLFEDFNCHEFEQDRLRETAELMAMPHVDDPNDEEYTHFCGHGEGPPEDGGFFDPPDGDFPDDIVDDAATIRVGSEEGRGEGRGENRGRGRGRDGRGGPEGGRGAGGGPRGGGGARSPGYTFDFPAVLPMELSFEPESVARDEETRAQLRFTQEEVGVHRDDLVRDSITLYAYSEAAPPLEEGQGAPSEDVIFKDNGYDVEFTGGDIADLEHLGDDGGLVLVAGQLGHEQVVWFLGEGEIEVTD